MLTDLSKKISYALSFEPDWLPIQMSMGLIRKIHDFQQQEPDKHLLVVTAEPGCGITTALRQHQKSEFARTIWLSARLTQDNATLYDRLARDLGVYDICGRLNYLAPYLCRLIKLRSIKVIFIDDIHEFMLDRSSANAVIDMISELSSKCPGVKCVATLKSTYNRLAIMLLKNIAGDAFHFEGMDSEDGKFFAREALRQLNSENNTVITFESDLQNWKPMAPNVGELVSWIKLAYAVAWISKAQIIKSSLNISSLDLWRILDEHSNSEAAT
ncbi:hypothetical protein HBN83_12000 [Pseudomonas fragi]|uniref:hypothetical protein n=1 Tax=Pseudomonas fragi TaxID=296 RepID=UPI00147479B6|nr:hypothetical protein [Pseudomonas fragi]NNB06630.1 hypothetical protein [Pseudomonas fragi]